MTGESICTTGGSFNYGYLYIPDRIAAPFLSGVNSLYVIFGWGEGVDYIVYSYREGVSYDHGYVMLSFNPAILVGDPHLQTVYGYEQDVPTLVGGVDQILHVYYLYNTGTNDVNRITIRCGYHPQMGGFFEVLVSPVPYYATAGKMEQSNSGSLHTRAGIISTSYDRPGGLMYKDPGDSLSTYDIADVSNTVCIAA